MVLPASPLTRRHTLWAVDGDAEELLPVYERLLPAVGARSFCGIECVCSDRPRHRSPDTPARCSTGRTTPAGSPPVPLWTISGDVDATLPTLVQAWTGKRYAYQGIADCWAEMGPRAAVAEPLLRAELADPARATYDGSSAAIPDDEQFLVAVAQALAAVTGQDDPAAPVAGRAVPARPGIP